MSARCRHLALAPLILAFARPAVAQDQTMRVNVFIATDFTPMQIKTRNPEYLKHEPGPTTPLQINSNTTVTLVYQVTDGLELYAFRLRKVRKNLTLSIYKTRTSGCGYGNLHSYGPPSSDRDELLREMMEFNRFVRTCSRANNLLRDAIAGYCDRSKALAGRHDIFWRSEYETGGVTPSNCESTLRRIRGLP